jgi:hypothetical protein
MAFIVVEPALLFDGSPSLDWVMSEHAFANHTEVTIASLPQRLHMRFGKDA